MLETYLTAMRNYGTLAGRTSRRDYWIYTLCFAGLMFAALILEGILDLGSSDVRPLMGLVSIIHLAPNVAITARRLHDQDRTALWMLLWLTGIGAIVTFVFSMLPGTPGTNRFGPEPMGSAMAVQREQRPYSGQDARPAESSASVYEEIERLAALRASGALSEEEFGAMKAKLLARSA